MDVDIVSRCVELPSEPGLPPCDVGVHAGSAGFFTKEKYRWV